MQPRQGGESKNRANGNIIGDKSLFNIAEVPKNRTEVALSSQPMVPPLMQSKSRNIGIVEGTLT